jgi:hypothetical protein
MEDRMKAASQAKVATVAILLVACALACEGPPAPPPSPPRAWAQPRHTPDVPDAPLVSLVRLLANPEKFDEKRITVAGWANIEFEGDALYLHEEDFRRVLLANAVSLSIPDDVRTPIRDQQGYMGVVGTFHAPDPNVRRSPYGGRIAVEFMERVPSREELWRETGSPERPEAGP